MVPLLLACDALMIIPIIPTLHACWHCSIPSVSCFGYRILSVFKKDWPEFPAH